jgi:ABC-type lipoprotein release transport system permease subunit
MEKLAVVIRIAFRNLFASRLKTAIVGGIILVGALLIVVGTSFVGSIVGGMSRSIIGSAAGDIQVYSSKSKDELAIWGQMGTDPDLAALDDFSKVKATLEKVPNVKAVVPMGISGAQVTGGNTIDLALADLRDAVRKQKAGDNSPQVTQTIAAEKAHVQHIVSVLQGDQKNISEIASAARATTAEEDATLAKAADPAFWQSFDADAYGHLEFLENKLAPLAADADLIYLRYIGTDLATFGKSFDRMQIVDGTTVPQGQRGFLFAKKFYEDQLKLKSARRLDKIAEALDTNHKTIAEDADLQRMVRENQTQTRELALQLDDVKAKQMVARLQALTGSKEADVEKLLGDFFKTDDANFHTRYRAFYAQIAPLLDLYRIRIGDTLTIKSYTKSGFVKNVNLKVYGTFQFKGLEKSDLAGSLNLMDLKSFRDLYGFLNPATEKEMQAIEKEGGTRQVDRKDAEAELFGADAPPDAAQPDAGRTIVANATPGLTSGNPENHPFAAALHDQETSARAFSQSELEHGAVLSAAVFLKDPSQLRKTIPQIEKAGTDAGLSLKAVSWQQAAGFIGQMVLLFWAIFVTAAIVIFVVAVVIINNALVMATLERVREIGTLRAIGAQKPFILGMLVVEATVMGVVFGAIGAGIGLGIVELVHAHGIGATADIMYFLFSGPRFMPVLSVASLFIAVAAMFVVSAFSSGYPAWLAMRISPVNAMQTED